ncbi:MAG: CsiV family protein, partial [Gammaproteobacteria bacterium]|nr:CsiV family protein [Gammaproteobacteria bacterium]
MKINRYLLLVFLVGLLSTVSQANVTDEEEIRFYDVEVIIFKNDRGPKSQEYILPVSSPRMDEEFLDLSSPLSIEAAAEKSFDIIPDAELRLTQTVIDIVKSKRFSLLAHTG